MKYDLLLTRSYMQQLSNKQTEVLETILHFFFNDKSKGGFVFSGVAGSGKTTIISSIVETLSNLNVNVVSLAFTGKAVSALINKNIQPAQTLHSFLYVPVYENIEDNDWDGVFDGGITTSYIRKFVKFDKKPKDAYTGIDFIIVDEASFVPRQIFMDLMDLEIPLLFVGDKEQLPPIDDTGFNIMDAADIHLDEIHRQAEGSPIIMLSKIVRETGHFNTKYVDGNVIRMINKRDINRDYVSNTQHDIVLCGTNNNRMKMNNLIRAARGYHEDYAENNEVVINLKNTVGLMQTGLASIYNGELFKVISSIPKEDSQYPHRLYTLSSSRVGNDCLEDVVINVLDSAWREDYTPVSVNGSDLANFTFGYAITVHKSQGSEFNNVLYIDDDVSFFTDQRKFRYTAITRAKDMLTIAK